jgi:hypothetical protein
MIDKSRTIPYTITILEINLKDKEMNNVEIAIMMAKEFYRDGYAWPEAVDMACDACDVVESVDYNTVDESFDS